MISRRITRKPENDNYRRLANYITDASRNGEKCLLTWCAGCWAGDDYELAIQEVADTQALNTRTTKGKTYHLIVSFRPEDEAKLTPDVLKVIETELAKVLDFEEHQRHCGVHKNTANLHMHVAYNMIHPEKLTMHEPFRDYHARDRVCRELEQRFGLAIDNGRNQERPQNRQRLGDKAATMEAHSGQQSFESYATGHRESILASLEQAADWQSLHYALALYGLEIKPHGNGLIIKNRHAEHTIKASSLDRTLAKWGLEKRFGPFQPPGVVVAKAQSQERYQASPLHRGPERGNLFAVYQAGIARRKAELSVLKEQELALQKNIIRTWERNRQVVEGMVLTRGDRFTLLKQTRQHEAEARRECFNSVNQQRQNLKQAIPYASWTEFLRWQAGQGNDVALAVLRSRHMEIAPEQPDSTSKQGEDVRQKIRKAWQGKELQIRGTSGLQSGEIGTLLSVAKMYQLAALKVNDPHNEEKHQLHGFNFIIDTKGTVLFTLGSGGMIRDTGSQIFFSGHDKVTREVALRFAQLKWGKGVSVDANTLQVTFKEPVRKLGATPPSLDETSRPG